MDFMLALNVTIYGLGIVFLALLVLMVAIMLLTKVFAVVAGRDILSAAPSPTVVVPASTAVTGPAPVAAETAEAVNAPLPGKILSVAVKAGDRVQKGDEVCVIEAMKMGNSVKAPREGFVAEVCVAQGNTVAFGAPLVYLAATPAAASRPPAAVAVPAAPTPVETTEPSAFTLGIAGKIHAVELAPAGAEALAVLFDGTRYEVRRDAGDRTKLMVNGQAHTVEVQAIVGSTATVMIDGLVQKVELDRKTATAPRAFGLASGGALHKVEVAGSDGAATVSLDGATYRVERDKTEPSRILVNGQAHTVEVKAIVGGTATVMIDGRTERVEIARETAKPTASTAAVVPAPTPTTPAAGAGQPVTAPLPGKILSVAVKAGDRVRKGDELCVIEAMKMGNSIKAQRDGVVREVMVTPGQTVAFGAVLLFLQ
jgi:biotin carboxyl carrier protein